MFRLFGWSDVWKLCIDQDIKSLIGFRFGSSLKGHLWNALLHNYARDAREYQHSQVSTMMARTRAKIDQLREKMSERETRF